MIVVESSVCIGYVNGEETRHALLHSDRDFEPIREHLGLETL